MSTTTLERQTTRQYLTFTLAEETYAVGVAQVREVLEVSHLTVLPRMADYIRGIINIRGKVLPVVDLRTKFGMANAVQTVDTAIIVMDVQTATGLVTVGCMADSVQEVIDMSEDAVQPAPHIGTTVDAQFVSGIGKRDERFIILLDLDRLFRTTVVDLGQSAAAQSRDP